jgi:hypothetical protein
MPAVEFACKTVSLTISAAEWTKIDETDFSKHIQDIFGYLSMQSY